MTNVKPGGASEDYRKVLNALGEFYSMVRGECPSLLEDDHNAFKAWSVLNDAKWFDSPEPAPVSPVEPTPEPPTEDWYIGGRIDKCPDPRCGCSMEHSPDCAMPAPTGAPAPCVWREMEDGEGKWRKTVMRTTCGLREDADEMRPLSQWPFCPQCGHPLTVER